METNAYIKEHQWFITNCDMIGVLEIRIVLWTTRGFVRKQV